MPADDAGEAFRRMLEDVRRRAGEAAMEAHAHAHANAHAHAHANAQAVAHANAQAVAHANAQAVAQAVAHANANAQVSAQQPRVQTAPPHAKPAPPDPASLEWIRGEMMRIARRMPGVSEIARRADGGGRASVRTLASATSFPRVGADPSHPIIAAGDKYFEHFASEAIIDSSVPRLTVAEIESDLRALVSQIKSQGRAQSRVPVAPGDRDTDEAKEVAAAMREFEEAWAPAGSATAQLMHMLLDVYVDVLDEEDACAGGDEDPPSGFQWRCDANQELLQGLELLARYVASHEQRVANADELGNPMPILRDYDPVTAGSGILASDYTEEQTEITNAAMPGEGSAVHAGPSKAMRANRAARSKQPRRPTSTSANVISAAPDPPILHAVPLLPTDARMAGAEVASVVRKADGSVGVAHFAVALPPSATAAPQADGSGVGPARMQDAPVLEAAETGSGTLELAATAAISYWLRRHGLTVAGAAICLGALLAVVTTVAKRHRGQVGSQLLTQKEASHVSARRQVAHTARASEANGSHGDDHETRQETGNATLRVGGGRNGPEKLRPPATATSSADARRMSNSSASRGPKVEADGMSPARDSTTVKAAPADEGSWEQVDYTRGKARQHARQRQMDASRAGESVHTRHANSDTGEAGPATGITATAIPQTGNDVPARRDHEEDSMQSDVTSAVRLPSSAPSAHPSIAAAMTPPPPSADDASTQVQPAQLGAVSIATHAQQMTRPAHVVDSTRHRPSDTSAFSDDWDADGDSTRPDVVTLPGHDVAATHAGISPRNVELGAAATEAADGSPHTPASRRRRRAKRRAQTNDEPLHPLPMLIAANEEAARARSRTVLIADSPAPAASSQVTKESGIDVHGAAVDRPAVSAGARPHQLAVAPPKAHPLPSDRHHDMFEFVAGALGWDAGAHRSVAPPAGRGSSTPARTRGLSDAGRPGMSDPGLAPSGGIHGSSNVRSWEEVHSYIPASEIVAAVSTGGAAVPSAAPLGARLPDDSGHAAAMGRASPHRTALASVLRTLYAEHRLMDITHALDRAAREGDALAYRALILIAQRHDVGTVLVHTGLLPAGALLQAGDAASSSWHATTGTGRPPPANALSQSWAGTASSGMDAAQFVAAQHHERMIGGDHVTYFDNRRVPAASLPLTSRVPQRETGVATTFSALGQPPLTPSPAVASFEPSPWPSLLGPRPNVRHDPPIIIGSISEPGQSSGSPQQWHHAPAAGTPPRAPALRTSAALHLSPTTPQEFAGGIAPRYALSDRVHVPSAPHPSVAPTGSVGGQSNAGSFIVHGTSPERLLTTSRLERRSPETESVAVDALVSSLFPGSSLPVLSASSMLGNNKAGPHMLGSDSGPAYADALDARTSAAAEMQGDFRNTSSVLPDQRGEFSASPSLSALSLGWLGLGATDRDANVNTLPAATFRRSDVALAAAVEPELASLRLELGPPSLGLPLPGGSVAAAPVGSSRLLLSPVVASTERASSTGSTLLPAGATLSSSPFALSSVETWSLSADAPGPGAPVPPPGGVRAAPTHRRDSSGETILMPGGIIY